MSNEDDEVEEVLMLTALQNELDEDDNIIDRAATALSLNLFRDQALFRRRWNSSYLIDLAKRESSFVSEYRVDPGGFDVLVTLIEEILPMNWKMAHVKSHESGSKPVTTASKVGAALIMLGGGRHMEAMRTHGLSKSYSYDVFRLVVRAINKHPALAINTDNSLEYCKSKASRIQERSSYGIFKYCTGCIDGLALYVNAPSKKKYKNQSRFRSGSKKRTCINVQAVCDGDYLIETMTVRHVGSTNDADCFETSSLRDLNQSLPFPYHWNGDAAYSMSDTMHIPFPGINLPEVNKAYDSYNFWQSQVRIMIEQTFGMFIQMFGIFWKPDRYDLVFFLEIVHCCFRLYNFIKKRKLPCLVSKHSPPTIAALDENGRLIDDSWRTGVETDADNLSPDIKCGCTLRDRIVEEIVENNYYHKRSRPH